MSTKGEVINDAYSQMRISGLTVTPSPELQSKALSRLEAFMGELEINNVCLEYNFTQVPDPSDETGVIQPFFLMMSTNLAVRLVPDFNKFSRIFFLQTIFGLFWVTSFIIYTKNQLHFL